MSMSDRDGFIWQDGKLVPWRDATTHVLTHSLHYGMGVFEGVRAYKTERGTAIFRLKEHTERLFRSAHIFQMQMPYSAEELNEAQKEVIRANKLESGYLRPLAFYGSEKMGVSPKGAKVHVIIAAWPWGAYLGEEGMQRGIRIKTSSYTRHHVNITMVRAKASGNYMNSILANNEDGILYRWDLTTNTFTQNVRLNAGLGQAYTPTWVGADGGVYAISNATLYAIRA